MTTYTTGLRLTLPVTGTGAGTWGNTVNDGITTLIDSALSGTAAVVMTDANYTLTSADGTTDEARNMFLSVTGTLTAARNVVCPSVSKLYFVKNATTGGFAITIKTTAGTGIAVPSGKIAALYCDATNVLAASTYFDSPNIVTPTGIVKNDVGLGNVDNTSNATERAAVATLTNKTIALGSNTVSGTTAQFNTALSDGDFATLAGSETLSNKTLVAPVLGAATATSVNKVALTAPATSATLTLVDGTTITGPSATTTLPGLSLANSFTTAQLVQPATDVAPLTLRGHASATANLLQIQGSASNALFTVGPTGAITVGTLPALGTPTSGDFSSGTFTWPTFNQNTTGYASALKSATTTVSVSGATAPSSGQVLMATSSTTATWQTPAASGTGTVTSVAALTIGSTGTDLSSSVANGTTTPVITLNVPSASASNRGVLSAADWQAFNSKQAAGSYLTSGGALGTPASGDFSGGTFTWPTFNQSTSGTASNLSGTPTLPSGTTLVAPVLGTPTSGNLSNCTVDGTYALGSASLPPASVVSGAFGAADNGKCVYATGAAVVIPNATMSQYHVVAVQNTTASAITITKTITNAYNASTGATLGASFSLPARCRMSIVFTSGTECYVAGNLA